MNLALEQLSSEENNFEEISEYILGLFTIENEKILNKELSINEQISFLFVISEKIRKVVIAELSESELKNKKYFVSEFINKFKKLYLIKIAQNLLDTDVHINNINSLKKKIFSSIIKDINYFDSIGFQKKPTIKMQYGKLDAIVLDRKIIHNLFENESEFNLSFITEERNFNKRRELIVRECFKNNTNKYLNCFKKKLLKYSPVIYKQLLLNELKELKSESIINLIQYLTHTQDEPSLTLKNNSNLDLLLQDTFWVSMLTERQDDFYLLLESIKNKFQTNQPLSEYENNLISMFYWLKSNPVQSLKTIDSLNELIEQQSICPKGFLSMLYVHIQRLKERFKDVKVENDFCKRIEEKTLLLSREMLREEKNIIKQLQKTKIIQDSKMAGKRLTVLITVVMVVTAIKYVHYNFFDIDGIYQNTHLKNTKLTMEAIPYFTGVKDSLNPVVNEIRQKQRLDYIKDLNSRYFKVFDVLLNPNLIEKNINDSLPQLVLSKELKSLKKINLIRSKLTRLFLKDKWANEIEPIIGPNLLTEIRSYGAICDFLVPALAHYTVIDKNGKFLVIKSKNEKEILKQDLITRYKKLPARDEFEPKNYIDKYDQSYKNILSVTDLISEKINGEKNKTMQEYKKSHLKSEKESFKIILNGIAEIEARLNDLNYKIRERHDFVVKHNTYRAVSE